MTDIVGFDKDELRGAYVEAADSATHSHVTIQNQGTQERLRVTIGAVAPNPQSKPIHYWIEPEDERAFSDFDGKIFLHVSGNDGYIFAVAVRSAL